MINSFPSLELVLHWFSAYILGTGDIFYFRFCRQDLHYYDRCRCSLNYVTTTEWKRKQKRK